MDKQIILPALTDELVDEFKATELLELDKNLEWQWSQLAVDFACILQIR